MSPTHCFVRLFLCVFAASIAIISPVYAHDESKPFAAGDPPEKLPPSNVATEGATHPNLASQATDPTSALI